MIAQELWDFESRHAPVARQVQVDRDTGALGQVQFALIFVTRVHILAGERSAAERLIDEEHLIAETIGNPPVGYAAMMLAALQGREQEASGFIQGTVHEATERGAGDRA